MKQDFRNTKIRIKSEEHSKAFQEAVFAAGGEWLHGGEIYRFGVNFIFLNDSLGMTYCDNAVYFQERDYKEIQFPFPIKVISTKHKEEAQMTRKVRKDFDQAKQYSVDVSGCSKKEKKEVQRAFFDAGFPWGYGGDVYRHLDAAKYTNTEDGGKITEYCMYTRSAVGCNMTAKEFLDLVYEPEQQGHVHAELMAQYAEDAKTSKTPWELWQVKCDAGIWHLCKDYPRWECTREYRRKPKTKLIHGVEIPIFEFTPKAGEKYYTADVSSPEFFEQWHKSSVNNTLAQRMIERGLVYPYTEEGKQAAILHSKAMLGIA